MHSLKGIQLKCNKKFVVNFDGGELSSDGGLLMIKESLYALGIERLLKNTFKTNDTALFRIHEDDENLLQMIYQIFGTYYEDNCADELRHDPILSAVLGKEALASQPTLSRFFNRMDDDTLRQFDDIMRQLRKKIYSVRMPEFVLFDIDTTQLPTYGKQDGEGFNYHYQASSWRTPRRVVFKIEKPYNQMPHMYTFIVTNMEELGHWQVIDHYCNRGRMENFIGEGKQGFDFASVSSRSRTVNANRLQLHALVYNMFNWFRRLVLPEQMGKNLIDTVRLKLLKIAAKVVHASRYVMFKLCSSCPYKEEVFEIFRNIWGLAVQLE